MTEESLLVKHPAKIQESSFNSISEMFEQAVERFKDKPAIKNLGVTLTYNELDQRSTHLAAYFQQTLGLKKGDRLAIMLPNCLQYVITMLAAFKAGLLVVNVNPLYTSRELVYQLNDAEPKAIVVFANVANTLAEAMPKVHLEHVIVSELGDAFPLPKALLVNLTLKYIKKMLPRYDIKSCIKFRQALRVGKRLKLNPVKTDKSDIAFLQYTGGTTGVAKGAMLSHGNLVANLDQAYLTIARVLTDDQEIAITPLPLYHVFSLMASCLMFLYAGVLNVLVTNPRDIPSLVKEFIDNRVTILMGVNTLFNALANNTDFMNLDLSSLHLVVAGGMAMQEAVFKHWREITGTTILEGYGLTETSPFVSMNLLGTKEYNGSIGMPLPSTDAAIVDDDGNFLSAGEIGELCIKGPQVMQGYWNMPEETKKVFLESGWLRTGDIAKLDDKGFIYIVDRKKDMIDVAGFNVYPNEVEAVLASHPSVLEVAVIGVPNRITGESVQAHVVSRGKKASKAELIAFCRKNLASYKVPRRFVFSKELPKTAVGKILRRELKGDLHHKSG